MKLATKLILTPLLLIVVLLAALQATLLWGLTGLVRKYAIPPAEKALAATVTLDSVSLNLLAGAVNADGITISNPQAFDEPTVFSLNHAYVDVAVASLLQQVADIAVLNAEGATLTVARNSEGKVNLAEWRKKMQPQGTPPPAEQPATPVEQPVTAVAPPEQVEQTLPKARIQSLGVDLLARYIDHKQEDGPFRMGLALRFTAEDIVTYPLPDATWGRIRISGHLEDDPQSFVIDLQGTLAPLMNPLAPSFDLKGSIASIDMEQFRKFTEKADIKAERASMDVALVCRNGVFQQGSSAFTLNLVNAQLTGDTARKNNFNGVLTTLNLKLPVGGTIDQPSIDWSAALSQTLMDNIANNPEAILKALDVDGEKVDKEVNRAFKKLGGFLDSLGK